MNAERPQNEGTVAWGNLARQSIKKYFEGTLTFITARILQYLHFEFFLAFSGLASNRRMLFYRPQNSKYGIISVDFVQCTCSLDNKNCKESKMIIIP